MDCGDSDTSRKNTSMWQRVVSYLSRARCARTSGCLRDRWRTAPRLSRLVTQFRSFVKRSSAMADCMDVEAALMFRGQSDVRDMPTFVVYSSHATGFPFPFRHFNRHHHLANRSPTHARSLAHMQQYYVSDEARRYLSVLARDCMTHKHTDTCTRLYPASTQSLPFRHIYLRCRARIRRQSQAGCVHCN